MILKNIYSKNTLTGIRIIASIALILLLFTTFRKIYSFNSNDFHNSYAQIEKYNEITSLFLNCFLIILSVILIIFPHRFLIISIACLFFSIVKEIFNTNSYISFLTMAIAIAAFLFRFDYKSHKILTISIFLPFILFECFFQLTKGLPVFIDMSLQKISVTFTICITIFFLCEYQKQRNLFESSKDKVLNIAKYKGLERSDFFLLQNVMKNVKYKDIAKQINGSEGAIRNKLGRIYKILEVGDKSGFLTIYSGYTLIYDPEEQ